MGYRDVYEGWKADPEGFWMQAAEAIDWEKKPTRALDDSRAPFYTWFADGVCNTCYNAVDRHVAAGRGAQAALIHDSPITGSKATISYAELQDQVAGLVGSHGHGHYVGVILDNGQNARRMSIDRLNRGTALR